LQKARSHGCNVASSPTLDGLIKILQDWGVNGPQVRHTIEQYRRAVALADPDVPLDAPIGHGGSPPEPLIEGDEGPFFAMEVQPS